ncbi:MAG: hypothetical protein HKN03_15435 [Acidimicrobiales bacterium]|nr:hypothetical protein [Acidimicrobiales bacterium]
MMAPSASQRQDHATERGSALIVTVAAIAAMLLFASIIVDVGFVMIERRRDQSAADLAVLAAVQDRYDEAAMAATALVVLNENLPAPDVTDAELRSCSAETLEPGWTVYPTYTCFAHNKTYSEIRLRIPTRTYSTALGQLAGINTIDHSAFAQAGAAPNRIEILPFALEADAGLYECVKTGTATPDCTGGNSGNFGDLELFFVGNPDKGTVNKCNSPNVIYPVNVAQGLDHDVAAYDGVPVAHAEETLCDLAVRAAATDPRVNGARPSSGNTPGTLAEGLMGPDTFPDGEGSRLTRLGTLPGFTSIPLGKNAKAVVVDDTPLWHFITRDLTGANVPRSCHRDQFVGALDSGGNMDSGGMNLPDDDMFMTSIDLDVANYLLDPANGIDRPDRMVKLLERCLTHYEGNAWTDGVDAFGAPNFGGSDPSAGCLFSGCTDPVFGYNSDPDDDIFDIEQSPRFGYVPQLRVADSLGSNNIVYFQHFRATFLQRVWGQHDRWDPGIYTAAQDPANSLTSVIGEVYTGDNSTARVITGFVFPPGSLPGNLAELDAVGKVGSNASVELTR